MPNYLIHEVVDLNIARKEHIKNVIDISPKVVVMYSLIMKSDSDDCRGFINASFLKRVKAKGVKVVIYEMLLEETGSFELVL